MTHDPRTGRPQAPLFRLCEALARGAGQKSAIRRLTIEKSWQPYRYIAGAHIFPQVVRCARIHNKWEV